MRFERLLTCAAVFSLSAFADPLGPLGAGGPTIIEPPVILGPTTDEVLVGPAMSVWGTATPYCDVHVIGADGARWCDVHVDSSGIWRCQVSVKRGLRGVSAWTTFLDRDGPSSDEVPFTVLEDVDVSGGGCSSAEGLLALAALVFLRRIGPRFSS